MTEDAAGALAWAQRTSITSDEAWEQLREVNTDTEWDVEQMLDSSDESGTDHRQHEASQ